MGGGGSYGCKRSSSLSLLSSKIPQGLLRSRMNKNMHLRNRKKQLWKPSANIKIILIILKWTTTNFSPGEKEKKRLFWFSSLTVSGVAAHQVYSWKFPPEHTDFSVKTTCFSGTSPGESSTPGILLEGSTSSQKDHFHIQLLSCRYSDGHMTLQQGCSEV